MSRDLLIGVTFGYSAGGWFVRIGAFDDSATPERVLELAEAVGGDAPERVRDRMRRLAEEAHADEAAAVARVESAQRSHAYAVARAVKAAHLADRLAPGHEKS